MQNNIKRLVDFTLVELLIVIAVISILASLFLPALQKAKASGIRITCLSNQKQSGLATQFYFSDNNDILAIQEKLNGSYKFWSEIYRDEDYINDTDIMVCPGIYPFNYSVRNYTFGVAEAANDYPDGIYTKEGDATNNFIFATIKAIKNPSEFIYLADSVYQYDPSSSYYSNSANGMVQIYGYSITYDKCPAHFRHGATSNFWYIDGHADSLNYQDYPSHARQRIKSPTATIYGRIGKQPTIILQ